jgi:hypothetical protein
MTTPSDCLACEERLPDLADDVLGIVVRGEVERHLEGCPLCRALRDALETTSHELAAGRPDPAPRPGLAREIARRTWRRPLTLAALWPASPERGGPPWRVQGLAAGMSLFVSTFIYVGALALHDPGSAPARAYRTVNRNAAALRSQGDEWLEDIRLVRVLVSTALGGRLDRVQEQVEDYRRLMEKRRKTQPAVSPVPNDRTPGARAS